MRDHSKDFTKPVCSSLLLNVPFKSFGSGASGLGHLAPAFTIGYGHFHGKGMSLDRAISLDQRQHLGTQLGTTSSHHSS